MCESPVLLPATRSRPIYDQPHEVCLQMSVVVVSAVAVDVSVSLALVLFKSLGVFVEASACAIV
jgi:hypothetical protein